MEKMIGHGKVSVPFFVLQPIETELKRAKLYQPDRLCFHIGVWDEASESARVVRMDATEWTLIPAVSQLISDTSEISSIVVGGGFSYPQRHQPYVFGTLIYRDLANNWTPLYKSTDWLLYHNNRFQALP